MSKIELLKATSDYSTLVDTKTNIESIKRDYIQIVNRLNLLTEYNKFGEGWRDEIGDAVGLAKVSDSNHVTNNTTDSTVDYTHEAAVSDFMYKNVQLNHDRDVTTSIYPHIHWLQAKDYSPNFMLQYRWHVNGLAYTSAWTNLVCNKLVYDYEAGTTMHQISYSNPIVAPAGSTLSDIVQFKVIRDNLGTTGFSGHTCPYNTGGNATTKVLSFDVHIKLDAAGSKLEMVK